MSDYSPFPVPAGPSALPDPVTEAEFYEGVPAKRAVAFGIDMTAHTAIAAALTYPIVLLSGLWPLWFLMIPIWMLVGLIYRAYSLAEYSATPGMLGMGIEFRNHQGEKLNLRQSVIHTGVFALCVVSGVGLLATSAFTLTSRRRQTLPDLVLGSTAINTPE